MTRMGSLFCLLTRSELSEKTSSSMVLSASVIWNVSVRMAPSKGT